jgi:hypothetical protein
MCYFDFHLDDFHFYDCCLFVTVFKMRLIPRSHMEINGTTREFLRPLRVKT